MMMATSLTWKGLLFVVDGIIACRPIVTTGVQNLIDPPMGTTKTWLAGIFLQAIVVTMESPSGNHPQQALHAVRLGPGFHRYNAFD